MSTSITSTPTTLDTGASEAVLIANVGANDVYIAPQNFVIHTGQSRTVYPSGVAVTATTIGSATSSVDVTVTATEKSLQTPADRVKTVAYAATVTPNCATTDVLNIGALTGAMALANPAGTPRDGQHLIIRLAQDATGSRVITFGSAYAFGTDVTATVPTTASAKYEMTFRWNAAAAKWRATQKVTGF